MAFPSIVGVRSGPAGRFDLAGLAALTVAFFTPCFSGRMFPVLDSASLFEQFHYFYSGVFFGQGIPRWYPYGAYGIPSDILRLGYLTPSTYLAFAIGWIFRVEDALLLFKIGVLLEYLTALAGMYLLAGALFASRATRLLVCVAVVGSTVWYAAPFFNFRIYYLFPLVLFQVVRFLQTHRAIWLAGAGAVGLAMLMGNPAYFAPLYVFTVTIIVLMLAADWLKAMGELARRPFEAVAAVVFVSVLAGAFGYATVQSTAHVTMSAPGRNASTGAVDLQTFLTYGGILDKRAVPRIAALGVPTHLENGSGRDIAVYVGLPMMIFFLGAFAFVRDRWFAALCTAMLSLVLLSFGGLFAKYAYFFPGMSYYRHIAHTYGLIKILLLLCAGFGMERFWRATPRVQMLVVGVGVALLALAGLRMGSTIVTLRAIGYGAAVLACTLIARVSSGPRAGVSVGSRRSGLTPLQAGLVIALVADLASFQSVVFAEVPPTIEADEKALLESTRVRRIRWRDTRTAEPADREAELAWRLASRPKALITYAFAYNFAHFDPCLSQVRSDMMVTGMAALTARLAQGGPDWNTLLGCGQPKLRVLDRGREEADGRVAFDDPGGGPSSGSSTIASFSANRLAIEADAPPDGDHWLVYADGYHPGWTATVNGVPAAVRVAFEGAKAVRLAPGRNAVVLEFRRPLLDGLARAFAAYGVLFSLAVLFVLVRTVAHELQPAPR